MIQSRQVCYLLGLYAGIRGKNTFTGICEVTTNKNSVAPYYINPRSKQNIRLKLFCFRTGSFPASHPDNCGYVQ